MENGIWWGLALGFLVSLFLVLVVAYARAGGLSQMWWGLTVAGRCNADAALKAKVDALLGLPSGVLPNPTAVQSPTLPLPPPKPSGESLRLLTALQSEARLVDFLLEDLSGASPQQIADGVRKVQASAAAALKKYLVLEPVLGGTEGERVTVAKGFDPSAVQVLGNVTGEPPYTGELQHPGWRVKELKLPAAADGTDQFVLQPAEVQV